MIYFEFLMFITNTRNLSALAYVWRDHIKCLPIVYNESAFEQGLGGDVSKYIFVQRGAAWLCGK